MFRWNKAATSSKYSRIKLFYILIYKVLFKAIDVNVYKGQVWEFKKILVCYVTQLFRYNALNRYKERDAENLSIFSISPTKLTCTCIERVHCWILQDKRYLTLLTENVQDSECWGFQIFPPGNLSSPAKYHTHGGFWSAKRNKLQLMWCDATDLKSAFTGFVSFHHYILLRLR